METQEILSFPQAVRVLVNADAAALNGDQVEALLDDLVQHLSVTGLRKAARRGLEESADTWLKYGDISLLHDWADRERDARTA